MKRLGQMLLCAVLGGGLGFLMGDAIWTRPFVAWPVLVVGGLLIPAVVYKTNPITLVRDTVMLTRDHKRLQQELKEFDAKYKTEGDK